MDLWVKEWGTFEWIINIKIGVWKTTHINNNIINKVHGLIAFAYV